MVTESTSAGGEAARDDEVGCRRTAGTVGAACSAERNRGNMEAGKDKAPGAPGTPTPYVPFRLDARAGHRWLDKVARAAPAGNDAARLRPAGVQKGSFGEGYHLRSFLETRTPDNRHARGIQ